jgi:hypothetical protein
VRPASRHHRRFSRIDAVVIAVATALGLMWTWLVQKCEYRPFFDLEGLFVRFSTNLLPNSALIADPLLAAWTLAWCIIRLLGPRPRWLRLVRQPGVAVGFAFCLSWVVGGLVTLRWGLDTHHSDPAWIDLAYVQVSSAAMLCSFGVFVAWAGTALDGRWRPEASWLDRTGRCLGIGWILFGFPSAILLKEITETFY